MGLGQMPPLWARTSRLPIMGTTAPGGASDQPRWLKQGLTTQDQRCGRSLLYSPLNPLYSWVFFFNKT